MFQRLRQKWKVSGWRLLLILITFATGGSLCGWLGRLMLNALSIEQPLVRIPLYIVIITILWPFCVLLISIPLGQFSFFRKYLKKLGKKLVMGNAQSEVGSAAETHGSDQTANGQLPTAHYSIAIFASGAGSNAQKIVDHFRHHPTIRVALIVCNKPGAGVLTIAEREKIPSLLIEKEKFFRGNAYIDELKAAGIQFLVLAGFLWKIPTALVSAFNGHIINIHPALLPGYGGKGMYGMFVHNAVIAAKEKESGITIHLVDEVYDHGAIIFQASCTIDEHDTPEMLAQKVHALEHAHYPRVIEEVVMRQLQKAR